MGSVCRSGDSVHAHHEPGVGGHEYALPTVLPNSAVAQTASNLPAALRGRPGGMM